MMVLIIKEEKYWVGVVQYMRRQYDEPKDYDSFSPQGFNEDSIPNLGYLVSREDKITRSESSQGTLILPDYQTPH
jgi:hypothetical protein